jgi:hypothetical protein
VLLLLKLEIEEESSMSRQRCSSSMRRCSTFGDTLDQHELEAVRAAQSGVKAELTRDGEDGESRQLHLVDGEQPE